MSLPPKKNEEEDKINYKITPSDVPEEIPTFQGIPELRKPKSSLDFTPANPILNFLKVPGVILWSTLGAYFIGKWSMKPFYLLILSQLIYIFFSRRVTQYKTSLNALAGQKQRLEEIKDYETVEWLNHIINRVWLTIEATVCSEIHSEVNKVLKQNCPPFLESLKLSEITLGTQPPQIEKIKFFDFSDDRIVLEAKFSFVPIQNNDALLQHFGKAQSHWNTCIQIHANVNRFLSLPVLVQDFAFSAEVRIELGMKKKMPFVTDFMFQFLEMPYIDFKFIPLKICDFMDIPLLSSFCMKLAKTQMQKLMIAPNAIRGEIDGNMKAKGTLNGVLCVKVHRLISHDSTQKFLTLHADGKQFGSTRKCEGQNPLFEEEFFVIIQDTTTTVQVTCHQEKNQFGTIFLRNLNKFAFSEQMHLANEDSHSVLSISTLFYPIFEKERKTESAILKINLNSIDELKTHKASPHLLYNTYCLISITCDATGRILDSYETKRIFASKSPAFNDSHKLFVRDFQRYTLSIQVMDDKNDSLLGYVKIPLSDIHDTFVTRYKLRNVESGEVSVTFEMEYVDVHQKESTINDISDNDKIDQNTDKIDQIKKRKIDKNENQFTIPNLQFGIFNKSLPTRNFINFSNSMQISLQKFSGIGSFYFIFETNYENFKMPPFSTELSFNRRTVLPIAEETEIRARLFKITINGDVLVGEEIISVKNTNEGIVVFDQIRVEFSTEIKEISQKPLENGHRFTQLKFSEFSNIVYSLTFLCEHQKRFITAIYERVLFRSGIKSEITVSHNNSSSKAIPIIKSDSANRIKDGKTESNTNTDDNKQLINFGAYNKSKASILTGNLEFLNLYADFPYLEHFNAGIITIHIIKAENIEPVDAGSADPFVNVYLNKERVYKTGVVKRTVRPVYNESFEVAVNRGVDRLGFTIFDYNSIATNQLICFKEFPLYNIDPGHSRHEIILNDIKTGLPTLCSLTVMFSFSRFN